MSDFQEPASHATLHVLQLCLKVKRGNGFYPVAQPCRREVSLGRKRNMWKRSLCLPFQLQAAPQTETHFPSQKMMPRGGKKGTHVKSSGTLAWEFPGQQQGILLVQLPRRFDWTLDKLKPLVDLRGKRRVCFWGSLPSHLFTWNLTAGS